MADRPNKRARRQISEDSSDSEEKEEEYSKKPLSTVRHGNVGTGGRAE